MSEHENDLYEAQNDAAERLASFLSNFKKTPKDRISLGYLAAREDGLKELWAEFTNNHKTIRAQSSPSDIASLPYFTSKSFDQTEEIYFEAAGRIAQKIIELTPTVKQAPMDNPQPSTSVNANLHNASNIQHDITQNNQTNQEMRHVEPYAQYIQIPRLNVPNFSGTYEEWTSFRDLFTAAVHSNPTLQPVHKLQYLKSLLKGDAEVLLKHTPITNENYAVAWRTLEDRFDNNRALITIQLRKLFSQQPAKETAVSIRHLLDNTRECINALELHNVNTATWDCILIYIISRNIPSVSLSLWEQSIARNELPTIAQLFEFLENRFRTLEFSPILTQQPSNQGHSRSKQQSFHTATVGCRVCNGSSHPLRTCPSFLGMSINQRINYVTKAKLCKNCFAFSHSTQTCQSSGRCNVCGLQHHSLLHLIQTSSAPGPTSGIPSSFQNSSTLHQNAPTVNHTNSLISRPTSSDNSILATALVKVTAFDGKILSFRALLDNGSQENFVSNRVIQFLGIKPQPTKTIVVGVGQSKAPKPLGKVEFTFGSHHDSSFTMTVCAVVLPIITYSMPNEAVVVSPKLISNLPLADPTYGTPGNIDILLSASSFAALTLPSIKKEAAASTIALETKLGWVLYGEASAESSQNRRACFHVLSDDGVSSALQQFWKLEEVTNCPMQSPDDVECQKIFEETHSRTKDGRYCVQLPFKHKQAPMLGSSRDRAIARWLQVERKLSTNDQLRADYTKCLNEYVQLGHMHPINTTEEQHQVYLPNGSITHTSYYLPHHAVIKTESTTTKTRVVFDASSKTSNGQSLNDTLLTGPVLQDNLVGILIRWRTHKIVIKADIAQMYRQVLVDSIHQPYQRIVWRSKCTDPIQDYQLRTVTFGTAAAPYLAIKSLYQLADDESKKYPIGAAALRQDFYVDDLLSGSDSVINTKEKQRQITEILRCGGFQIRKWSSNSSQTINHLEKESLELQTSPNSLLKTLGIMWCPKLDRLSIKVNLGPNKVSSKRTLLAEVAKLFDPLGWIAPVIISMKILLQRLWLAGLSWDDPLPHPIQAAWDEFHHQIPFIDQNLIDRWLATEENSTIELHGFCDASEKAYAAVVYARVKGPDHKWVIRLVAAKTKVAPIKQISLPRLELCAASLLSQLIIAVNTSLRATKIYAWTDSEIVLAWLQGHPNRWATFVANRVSDIHGKIDAESWRHVASKDNPADCASRGILPKQLLHHLLWWQGPPWLGKDEKEWPIKHKREIATTAIESKKVQTFLIVSVNDTLNQILENCSTLGKAIRVTALIRRWRFAEKSSRCSPMTVSELTIAKRMLIKHTQKTHFPEEVTALMEKQEIPKKSTLLVLVPFLDADLLLRVGGRLKNADIPFDEMHPIIIPRKSRLSHLLIDETHMQTMHGGAALMLAHLRNQYWLIDPRNSIRQRIHKCNICFRYSSPTLNQLMGNLPRPRVNVSLPFTHTGVDYAGPISIRLRRCPGRPVISKGYICLFVCLATKAIHLELVGDMSAATFLAALNRFTSRRGLPSDIYSDNGTYFVRAAHDIDADMIQIQKSISQEASKIATQSSIQWHFIPPSAPHFGGLWEAGVKSTKRHLKRIIGDGTLTYEEMATTLCQIESCLNSRPLCPISNDPNDFRVLTPGHFLIGRPLLSRPQPSVLEIPSNRINHWQIIHKLTEQFWRQWQIDYFARLQQRPKWLSKSINIQKNELVLLKDDNLPPSQWKMARVIDTHQGTDGLTRVVTIKTATTTLKRPVVKLCKLPSQ